MKTSAQQDSSPRAWETIFQTWGLISMEGSQLLKHPSSSCFCQTHGTLRLRSQYQGIPLLLNIFLHFVSQSLRKTQLLVGAHLMRSDPPEPPDFCFIQTKLVMVVESQPISLLILKGGNQSRRKDTGESLRVCLLSR